MALRLCALSGLGATLTPVRFPYPAPESAAKAERTMHKQARLQEQGCDTYVPNLIPVTLGLLATLLRRQLHFAFSLSSG